MELIVRDKIIQIENRETRQISDLREKENESKALIRDEERLLLAMIGRNPHKWTSKTMNFNITSSEIETAPNVGIEILKSVQYSELKKNDQIDLFGWRTVGRVQCFDNLELSFEFRRIVNGFNFDFEIGEWFGLQLSKDGTCFLRLNDLYNDKKYHYIKSKTFDLHYWYKEYSTQFQIIKSSETHKILIICI